MLEISAGTLLLIPASLAVTFMLWVLWSFLIQDSRIASLFALRRKGPAALSKVSVMRRTPLHQPAWPKAS